MSKMELLTLRRMIQNPEYFIERIWGLKHQPVKPEFDSLVTQYIENGEYDEIRPFHFMPFEKGNHITWQQWLIVSAIRRGLEKKAPMRISTSSGHGIGKSSILAMLVLWYLSCYPHAQIPCTAPTSDQMHDILWKELSIWLKKMPDYYKSRIEWTTGYLRMLESPETWFARAKTARKENPEALAGVHGDYVFMAIDEASGIDNAIFNTAEGAMTGENVLVLMISNPTRTMGYFYDSHHSDKPNWQTLQFSSEDSPIVDPAYVQRIIDKHGQDSDEYKIRVLGRFPNEDSIDDSGYTPLLIESDLKYTPINIFIGTPMMGIDPAGEGVDKTTWVVRDNFKSRVVAEERISNEKSIAQKTVTLMELFNIDMANVTIDNFGVGANVAKELALIPGMRINVKSLNVGEPADDKDRFINKRAEAYDRMKHWIRQGGELVPHDSWDELLQLRQRRELSGKLKIMGKAEMRKKGFKSPNTADALMLTFTNQQLSEKVKREQEALQKRESREMLEDERDSVI